MAFWLAPWLAWTAASWVTFALLGESHTQIYVVTLLIPLAPALAQLAWRLGADLARGPKDLISLRVTLWVLSASSSVIFALTVAARGFVWLAAGYAGYALLVISASLLGAGARRFSVMRVIQDGDTAATLYRDRSDAEALAEQARRERGTWLGRFRRRLSRAIAPTGDR